MTRAGPAKAHIDPSLGDNQQLRKKRKQIRILDIKM